MLTWRRAEQECGDHLNDIGSSPSDLQALFADCELSAQLQAPLASLAEDWTEKTGVNAANPNAWAQRFERFTKWVLARSETRLIVVAHYGFVFEGLGLQLDNCEAVQCSVCEDDGWKVMKRAPGKGTVTDGGSTAETRPFPIGEPPVLQPQGLVGTPYSANMSGVLRAMVPLSVILAVLAAALFAPSEPSGGAGTGAR